jgi:hypothetical protein
MSNIEVFYLHYSKFNIRCSIFFHTSFLNLMILRLRRKEGSFSTLSLFDPLSAAGEERVVDPLKAEQTGPRDSFGGESMGRVQLIRQFEMQPIY